jgi:hypothetical protein
MAPTAAAPRLLSHDDVLALTKRPPRTEVVDVPAWGGGVTVRALSGAARDEYEAFIVRFNATGQVSGFNVEGKRAKLLSLALVNPDGTRMFKSPADVLALGDLDSGDVDVVMKAVLRLSGMSQEELAAAKNDFTDDQNGSSGTDSPATSE